MDFLERPEEATSTSFSPLLFFLEIWLDLLLPALKFNYQLYFPQPVAAEFPSAEKDDILARLLNPVIFRSTTCSGEMYIFLLGQMVEVQATLLDLSLIHFFTVTKCLGTE